MKHFDVVSIFPEMFKAITKFGITRRALEMGLYDLSTWNPRDFSILDKVRELQTTKIKHF